MSNLAANSELWRSAISRLQPLVRREILGFVDLDNPPSLEGFLEAAVSSAAGGPGRNRLATLLIDEGVLAHVLGEPGLIGLDVAANLMRAALDAEPQFDALLLRHLTHPRRAWPEDVPALEMMRVLDLLRLTTGVRDHSVIVMRRFLTISDPQIRSRAIKMVTASHPAFVESAFADPNPRVRANLLESVCDDATEMTASIRNLLVRGTADPNHRVATTALYYLAKQGDKAARQKLNELMEHTNPAFRRAAGWAIGKLSEAKGRDTSSSSPALDPELAAALGPSAP